MRFSRETPSAERERKPSPWTRGASVWAPHLRSSWGSLGGEVAPGRWLLGFLTLYLFHVPIVLFFLSFFLFFLSFLTAGP